MRGLSLTRRGSAQMARAGIDRARSLRLRSKMAAGGRQVDHGEALAGGGLVEGAGVEHLEDDQPPGDGQEGQHAQDQQGQQPPAPPGAAAAGAAAGAAAAPSGRPASLPPRLDRTYGSAR